MSRMVTVHKSAALLLKYFLGWPHRSLRGADHCSPQKGLTSERVSRCGKRILSPVGNVFIAFVRFLTVSLSIKGKRGRVATLCVLLLAADA